MFDLNEITYNEWKLQSDKLITHAGSWSLEYIEDMNKITRVYSTAFTLASLDKGLLQIIILSHTDIEQGEIKIENIQKSAEDKILVTLLVGDIAYLMQLHAPGISQSEIDSIHSVQLAELLIDDIALLHKDFAKWVISILPPASIRTPSELHDHLHDLLKMPFVSYIPSIINQPLQFEQLFNGFSPKLQRVIKTLVRNG